LRRYAEMSCSAVPFAAKNFISSAGTDELCKALLLVPPLSKAVGLEMSGGDVRDEESSVALSSLSS